MKQFQMWTKWFIYKLSLTKAWENWLNHHTNFSIREIHKVTINWTLNLKISWLNYFCRHGTLLPQINLLLWLKAPSLWSFNQLWIYSVSPHESITYNFGIKVPKKLSRHWLRTIMTKWKLNHWSQSFSKKL